MTDKELFIERANALIEGRRENPGWLYKSGVSTTEPYVVHMLGNKNEKKEGEISITSVFNNNAVFEDGSISFDVFSSVFLRKTRSPKHYFELVPIVLRREKDYSYNQSHLQNGSNLVGKKEGPRTSQQWEKHEAKAFFNYFLEYKADSIEKKTIRIADFEMPLFVSGGNPQSIGAVDLLGISADGKTVYLLELKNVNSTETLVRSSLEIYTYYSRLGLNRSETRNGVIERIKNDYGSVFNDVTDIRPGVLLINGSNQHKVYDDMKRGDGRYQNLAKLMDKLELKVFVVNRYRGQEIVPFQDEQDVVEYKEVEHDKTKVRPVVKLAKDEILKIEIAN